MLDSVQVVEGLRATAVQALPAWAKEK